MQLSSRACASQAAEYHFCEDIRGHVTTAPFGIEIFSGRSPDHLIHCLSRCDEIFNPLPSLHQHVMVVLQICTRRYWTMSRHDLRLLVSLRQNSIERMDHAIDRSARHQIDDGIEVIRENVSYDSDIRRSDIDNSVSVRMRGSVVFQCQLLGPLMQSHAA